MIKLLTVILIAMLSLSAACRPSDESDSASQSENQSIAVELDGVQMLLAAKNKLEGLDGFYTITEGATTSVGIKQSILVKRFVCDGSVFKQSVSYSFMIKTATQTLAKDDKLLLRKSEKVNSLTDVIWQDTASELTKEEYLEKFGSVNVGLSNFIITEATIKSAEAKEDADGYLITVSLDCQTSTEYIAKEMKFNSGSSELPTFQSIALTVSLDFNGAIKSVRYRSEYKIKMPVLGNVSCNEDTTERFYLLENNAQIPEWEFFSQYF